MKKFLFLLFVVSILFFSLLFLANATFAEEEIDEAVLPPPTDPSEEYKLQTGYVYVTPLADALSSTKTVVVMAGTK